MDVRLLSLLFVKTVVARQFLFIALSGSAFGASAKEAAYGNLISRNSPELSVALAQQNKPNEVGAIGRNREGYFHVRFQMGLHHLANHAIATKNVDAFTEFVLALDYSFGYQKTNGDFDLVIPERFRDQGLASIADQVSGVAFFMSSVGSGLYAAKTSDWVQESKDFTHDRGRLAVIEGKLPATLRFLTEHADILKIADQHAPNRLLFNAIAFHALGKLLDNEQAYSLGGEFVKLALAQMHEEGYFVEGGGSDTSYNGVASALAFRLAMLGCDQTPSAVVEKSIRWQVLQITESGELSTFGNRRVDPIKGETFLGRRKEVDVPHTLEALMLASVFLEDPNYARIGRLVFSYYEKEARRYRSQAP